MFYVVKSDTKTLKDKVIEKLMKQKEISDEFSFVFDYEEKNNFGDAFSEYLTLSFDGKPKAIILKNADFLNRAKNEKDIEHKFKSVIDIENINILILTVDKINRTGKLIKKYSNSFDLIELDSPKGNNLINFINNFFGNKNIEIENGAIESIIKRTGENFDLIISELKKIEILVSEKITNDMVEKCVIDFSRHKLYKITEHVLNLNVSGIEAIIKQLRAEGEGIYIVADALVREVSKFLRFYILKKKGCSDKEIKSMTEWNSWGIANYNKYLNKWINVKTIHDFFYDIILQSSFINMIDRNPNDPLKLLETLLVANIIKIKKA